MSFLRNFEDRIQGWGNVGGSYIVPLTLEPIVEFKIWLYGALKFRSVVIDLLVDIVNAFITCLINVQTIVRTGPKIQTRYRRKTISTVERILRTSRFV